MRIRAVIRVDVGNTMRDVRGVLLVLIAALRELRARDPDAELRIEHADAGDIAGLQFWTSPDRQQTPSESKVIP